MQQAGLLFLALLSAVYGAISGNFLGLPIGALLVLLAFSGLVRTATQQDFEQIAQFGTPWGLLLIAALACSATAAWLARQDVFSRMTVYIWLSALLLAVLAGIVHDRQAKPVSQPKQPKTNNDPRLTTETQGWDRLDWLAIFLLTILALGLRLYRLDGFLPTLHGDEGEMGLLALLALHGPASGLSPDPLPFFATGFLDHPTLFHYMQAGAMWLFGETETGLRVLSAIFGALCVPFLYAIGRRGWGRVAGLTTGWLLAVSHLHIHYSRIALNNIETVWFTILFIFLFSLLYERRQPNALPLENFAEIKRPSLLRPITLGLIIGLSQYFYYGSRLLPLLAVPFLLYLGWAKRLSRPQLIGLILATVIAYLPLFSFYAQNLPAFINRTRGVSVFNPEGLAHTLGPNARWPQDIPQLLWTQIQHTVNFFMRDGDHSTFYLADIPAFDPLTVLLFWLGLGAILSGLRRFHEFMVITWFGLGILLSSILTMDAPNGPRLIVAVPAVYLMGGVFVQRIYTFLANVWPHSAQWAGALLGSALAAVILYLNFTTYFVTYPHLMPNITAISIAHEMEDNHAQFRSFLLGEPQLSVQYGTLRFVARDAERYDVMNAQQVKPLVEGKTSHQDLLFIALPDHKADLAAIERLYPNGTESSHQNHVGDLLYLTYRIQTTEHQ